MARKLRVEYPGAIYHVINRGDRRELIFREDRDRELFLKTLAETCEKAGWQIHAYCLMPNHFHMVIETPEPNLVAGMKWFLGTYTSRFNRRHKLFGHLFSGRYKSLLVDGSGNGYLKSVCDYVHLNPIRAKMLGEGQKLGDYGWSSYPAYLKTPRMRPAWLQVARLLGECKIPKDSAAGRREFARQMEARAQENHEKEWRAIRRGWCLGDEEFREELLEQMEGLGGEYHHREELNESAAYRAQVIIKEELKKLKWKEEDLLDARKGDKRKLKMALRLRRETTLSLKEIAGSLSMGSWGYLARLLHEAKI
jgi:putative transposase